MCFYIPENLAVGSTAAGRPGLSKLKRSSRNQTKHSVLVLLVGIMYQANSLLYHSKFEPARWLSAGVAKNRLYIDATQVLIR